MNFIFIFILLLNNIFLFSNNQSININEELILIDSIAVLRAGASGLTPIYYSDAWFLNPFGLVKNLEEIIIENIWIAYGNEHGIKMTSDGVSNEYAEQYLDMLQQQKGVSRKKIEEMAQELNYSIDDLKRELNNKYLVQQTIDTFFAASGQSIVSDEEIKEFYNNNPKYDEDSFIIESGTLKITNSQKVDIDDPLIIKNIIWSGNPYLVLKNDLNDNFINIDKYLPGDIVYYEYNSTLKEILCYRLLEKKNKIKLSINSLYEDITKQLQSFKYEAGYKEMTKNFLLSSLVNYYDNDLQGRCLNFLNK